MQTNRELLISIDMCITSKHRVDATQPSNTPTAREKLPQAIFKN
jgi:hypothetical protein